MTLFRVDLHRTEEATLYVDADSDEEAIEGALELVTDGDWFSDFGPDAVTTPALTSRGNKVWSGGPKGSWGDPR